MNNLIVRTDNGVEVAPVSKYSVYKEKESVSVFFGGKNGDIHTVQDISEENLKIIREGFEYLFRDNEGGLTSLVAQHECLILDYTGKDLVVEYI